MKTWAIVLSLYVTLLAAMPCCMFDNCPDDKAQTEQTLPHDQGDDDGCGTCSPFFNCSTCNVSFIAASLSFDFAPACVANQTIIAYNPVMPSRISGKIWQPPKLS